MAIKLKELPAILVRSYIARTNVALRGRPAIGKSETVEAFCKQMAKRVPGFKVWRLYAPTMSPMDVQASAPDYDTGLLRFFNNAALPNAYTDPDAVGAVFIDEMNNTDPTTLRLLQKYVNREDMSNVLRLPAGVIVIAASNRLEDKSGVQQQGRAFMSRFEQHEVFTDARDNIDHAAKCGWHPTIQLFFKDHPHLIDNYDEVFETSASARGKGNNAADPDQRDQMTEEGKLGIWANMRSWARVNAKEFAADTLSEGGARVEMSLAEATSNLGEGVGIAYDTHKRALGKLASFEQIMANPGGIVVPGKPDEQFAISMILAHKCREDQLGQVRKFGERLPLEMQAVILRHLSVRKGFELGNAAGYTDWITSPGLNALMTGR